MILLSTQQNVSTNNLLPMTSRSVFRCSGSSKYQESISFSFFRKDPSLPQTQFTVELTSTQLLLLHAAVFMFNFLFSKYSGCSYIFLSLILFQSLSSSLQHCDRFNQKLIVLSKGDIYSKLTSLALMTGRHQQHGEWSVDWLSGHWVG